MLAVRAKVIVYKMLPLPGDSGAGLVWFSRAFLGCFAGKAVSFNFNKLRAMIASRTLVAVQLDKSLDRLRAGSSGLVQSLPTLTGHRSADCARGGEALGSSCTLTSLFLLVGAGCLPLLVARSTRTTHGRCCQSTGCLPASSNRNTAKPVCWHDSQGCREMSRRHACSGFCAI